MARAVTASRLTRLAPRTLASIRVELNRVLDLTDPHVLHELGINVSDITGEDVTVTRAIGEAAHHLGMEAVMAPSATGQGTALAILIGNRAAASSIEVVKTEPYRLEGMVEGDTS